MKLKTIVLVAAAIAAFVMGIWFFVSPSLNRQADMEMQGELLDSILTAMENQSTIVDVVDIPCVDGLYGLSVEQMPTVESYAPPYDVEISSEPIYEPYTPYEPTNEYVTQNEPEPTPIPIPLDPSAFPNGIVPLGILTIENINLRLPIMEGVDEPELRIAPGRVPQTAGIGEIGNAVIAGHRNFTFGAMFNRLGEVEIGNIIEFQAMDGVVMTFEVFEILVILPENQIAFIQPQNESIITLFTCTPIREATHRLLIRARKIEGGF